MDALQGLLAGALVLASALYAGWRLMPARGRVRLLGWLVHTPVGSGKWLTKLRSAAGEDGSGGCGSCGAGQVRSRPAARTRTPAAPRR